MVVGAQNVDRLIIAADDQFVIVVSDVRNDIGEETVGAAENEILVRAELGRFEPERAFLLIGIAPIGQHLNDLCRFAVVMKGRFSEPVIVFDPVAEKVAFQSGNVERERISDQCRAALFFRNILVFIAVDRIERLGMVDDVLTMIAVLRHIVVVLRSPFNAVADL